MSIKLANGFLFFFFLSCDEKIHFTPKVMKISKNTLGVQVVGDKKAKSDENIEKYLGGASSK